MEHKRRFYGRMVDGITYIFSGELTFSKKCEVHLFSFKNVCTQKKMIVI